MVLKSEEAELMKSELHWYKVELKNSFELNGMNA